MATSQYTTFCSLDYDTSKIQKLAVGAFEFPMDVDHIVSVYPVLNAMVDLRTPFLNQCNNPYILHILDPSWQPTKTVLCPKLESLLFYVEERGPFNMRG